MTFPKSLASQFRTPGCFDRAFNPIRCSTGSAADSRHGEPLQAALAPLHRTERHRRILPRLQREHAAELGGGGGRPRRQPVQVISPSTPDNHHPTIVQSNRIGISRCFCITWLPPLVPVSCQSFILARCAIFIHFSFGQTMRYFPSLSIVMDARYVGISRSIERICSFHAFY